MSSKRILKKEINGLTQAFISDAFGIIGTHPEKRETVITMISDVVSLRNDTIVKLNHPEVPEGNTLQSYVREARTIFIRDLDSAYQELSQAVSEKKKPAGSSGKSRSTAGSKKKEEAKEGTE